MGGIQQWKALLALAVGLGLGCGVAPEKPAGQQADWMAQVERQIAAREYWASENADGLQAPNRRQNLRTYFDSAGIRIRDRVRGEGLFELRLADVGRGETRSKIGRGQVVAEGARVEIRRPGLVEWYVNGSKGLEHGFEVETSLPGEGPLVLALTLDGARAELAEDSLVLTSETGRRLDYGKLAVWDATGRSLVASLRAPAADRIEIEVDDRLAEYPIVIDPLITAMADASLDGAQLGATLGSSVASAGDVNGDGLADVIVGAPHYDGGLSDEGAAFIFLGTPAFLGNAGGIADGDSTTADTQISGLKLNSLLGSSVASAGDVNGDGFDDIIVGASGYPVSCDVGPLTCIPAGAAVIFLGSATGIADGDPTTAHARLDGQTGSGLGSSVASAGDVNGDGFADVIVGAPAQNKFPLLAEGAAFVFLGSASGIASGDWTTADGALDGTQSGEALGQSVAAAGDVNGDGFGDVIVGAPHYDAAFASSNEGAAFVFLGSVSGIPTMGSNVPDATLLGTTFSEEFGWSVATAGDVNGDGYSDVVVGARSYGADPNILNAGAAFIYLGAAAGITSGDPSIADTQLLSNQAGAQLGHSVARAGDVNGDGYSDVIVGAPLYDAGQMDEGAAFVFLGSSSGVASGGPTTAFVQLESDQVNAEFGVSVASAGDVNGDGFSDVIAGAGQYDAGLFSEGSAFVYLGAGTGLSPAFAYPNLAATRLQADQVSALFGQSVATGDFNGDGYADVAVGAPNYDAGQTNEGAVFVFDGGIGGLADAEPTSAATQLESNQANAKFGFSIANAGDVDGDGDEELLVGAYSYDDGSVDEGEAFLFEGSPTGIPDGNPATADATFQSNQTNAFLGIGVAGLGDVNGDGYADIAVSAHRYDAGQTNEGAAFVYHGSSLGIASGDPTTADATIESDQASAELGRSVASAGDVNGDGFADLIVGAYRYDAGQTDEGAAFVFHGSASGIASGNPATADAQLESNQVAARMGQSVASAGDINGDGYGDVIVGAPLYDNPSVDEGAAFVFQGSSAGVRDGNPGNADAMIDSDVATSQLGYSVSSAGDINGDRFSDIVVGAPFFEFPLSFPGTTDDGAAFVFLGSVSGIASGSPFVTGAAAYLGSSVSGTQMGASVAAGDVNGDGFSDVVVGANRYDAGQTDEGGAFVFLGNGANGRLVHARQYETGATSADATSPWGGVNGSTFDVSMVATHPEGRGRVKLEVEWCPPAVPFGWVTCGQQVSSAWADVTATPGGVELRETIPGLALGTLVRWRARVLYAQFGIDAQGITPPANPAHGPWRRPTAQAREADVRTVLSFPPSPQSILINDDTFMLADWLVTVTRVTGGATQQLQFSPTGGNPDAYRHMEQFIPGADSIEVFHAYQPTSYSPSVQGPILQLDYAEDRIELTPPFSGAVAGASPALTQDGVVYFGPNINFSDTSWTTLRLPALTAADFDDGTGLNPDFSATGGSIQFGYLRFSSSGNPASTFTIVSGIDNWSYRIHYLPEPSTALALGCGALMLAGLRKRETRSYRALRQ